MSQELSANLVRIQSTLDRINAPNMKALEKLVITPSRVIALCGIPSMCLFVSLIIIMLFMDPKVSPLSEVG